MKNTVILLVIVLVNIFYSCKKNQEDPTATLQLQEILVGSVPLNLTQPSSNVNLPIDQAIVAKFTGELDIATVPNSVTLTDGVNPVPFTLTFLDENKSFSIKPDVILDNNKNYILTISDDLKGSAGETFPGIAVSFNTAPVVLKILSFTVAGKDLLTSNNTTDVDLNFPAIIQFDHPVDPVSVNSTTIRAIKDGVAAPLTYSFSDSDKMITLQALQPLVHFEKYTFTITSDLAGKEGEVFNGFSKDFYTALDSTPKFPVVSDDELLTIIEQQTFNYFWNLAHPVCGLARERETSGDLVTIGGSGFGVMAILVGIERNFITRQEGVDRLEKIVNFLTTADRFHGAWPHWMSGSTGKVIQFSSDDDGADLVETSYMIQGLLTVRQFLSSSNSQENMLIEKINALWESVEWTWFTKGGEEVLYWHWSPDNGWIMNMQIKGYDEALITYFLAAASPTYSIDASVYHNGWASNGAIINGNSYYGYTLPVGVPYGGPLFFAHYSFLGLNPHNLQDDYANYWTQNVNHSLINHDYCSDNPKNYVGYSTSCWGLTASDNQNGYSSHSPTNDLGVIAPTAAISSLPYTPEYSLEALHFFYYTIGDKLWGPYGFYDAFNTTEGWYGKSDLAIDEGPIIIMIENYRSGLLWDMFMSCPEVTIAMDKLGFTN